MKKYGKDILFCLVVALGSVFLPLLISFIFMAVTGREDLGSIIFVALLLVCGIIAPIFCVLLKKNYLIYPAVNAVCFAVIAITASIGIISQFAPLAVWKDGNEFETLLSIFMVPLAIGLMVFLVGIVVVISAIVSLGTLLISYLTKIISDKNNAKPEITENEKV